jgi:hypothetical protein
VSELLSVVVLRVGSKVGIGDKSESRPAVIRTTKEWRMG